MVTVDYVTDSYCKVKTLVAQRDSSNAQKWGHGLFFRVFTPNKEVSFEIKVRPLPADHHGLQFPHLKPGLARSGLGPSTHY